MQMLMNTGWCGGGPGLLSAAPSIVIYSLKYPGFTASPGRFSRKNVCFSLLSDSDINI